MGIEEGKQKTALLLQYGGPEVDETFDKLQGVGDHKRLQKGRRETNRSFLSACQYNVRSKQAKQKDGETLDSFHSRLRNLVKTCDFRKSRQRNQSTDYLELLVKFPSAQSPTYLVSWMLVKPLELCEIQAGELENHGKTVNVEKFNKKGTSTQRRGKRRHP